MSKDEAAVEQYDPAMWLLRGRTSGHFTGVRIRPERMPRCLRHEKPHPFVDALAECGVLDQAYPRATTLNCTLLLSSLDPHARSVVDGYQWCRRFPIAEHLGAAGWDTIAVVGAMAPNLRWTESRTML